MVFNLNWKRNNSLLKFLKLPLRFSSHFWKGPFLTIFTLVKTYIVIITLNRKPCLLIQGNEAKKNSFNSCPSLNNQLICIVINDLGQEWRCWIFTCRDRFLLLKVNDIISTISLTWVSASAYQLNLEYLDDLFLEFKTWFQRSYMVAEDHVNSGAKCT